MGEFKGNLAKQQIKLPPWVGRLTENATESAARWEELKLETVGVANLIKVGFHYKKLSYLVHAKYDT